MYEIGNTRSMLGTDRAFDSL